MRWFLEMSCQFGMLSFNRWKRADLGWMPGWCKCCMCTVGFQRHLLALFTENLRALFVHSDAKPLAFVLRLGRAGESACREQARGAHQIHSLGKQLCHGCWSRWWEAGAWHCSAWEHGKGNEAQLPEIRRERLWSDPFCEAGGVQGRIKKLKSVTCFLAVEWNTLLALWGFQLQLNLLPTWLKS